MKTAVDARAAVWYRGTGIGTYTFQLLRNMLKYQKDLEIIYPEECKDYKLTNQDSHNQEKYSKDKFWELLESNKCNIPSDISLLHIPHNGLGEYQTNAKKIITLHDVIPVVMPDTVGVFYHKVFLDKMSNILEKAARIITVSEHSKKDICSYFAISSKEVDVIYEAPESIYKPLNKSIAQNYVIAKYRVKPSYILYLGGFSPRKNVALLIKAYKEVRAHFSDPPKLVIVGKLVRNFKEVFDVIDKYKLQDDVIFTGYVPVNDLPAIYNSALMFVYPSLYEGFGLPPLEAMACGIPTICGDNSSLPEVVGDCAHVVNVCNASAVAEGIIKIIEDQQYAATLKKSGLRRAQNFSWEKTARETLVSYGKALT